MLIEINVDDDQVKQHRIDEALQTCIYNIIMMVERTYL